MNAHHRPYDRVSPQLAIVKGTNGKPDMKAAREDWESDSNGKLEMKYGMFYNAIFELVDVWCEVSAPRAPPPRPFPLLHSIGHCLFFYVL